MSSIRNRIASLEAEAWDFSPAILQAQHAPPSPLPRLVLYMLLTLCAVLLLWAVFGRLDIVAVAQGKLVPETFLKVVQPSDSGVVKEILVKEGDEVAAGQVLMRMDTSISTADGKVLDSDFQLRVLQLRRIDAELNNLPLARKAGDDPALFAQVEAQYRAHRQAYVDALDTERAALGKAQHDLKSAIEVESKLKQTLPIFQEQEKGWDQLAKEGFAGKLMALDRTRSRIETQHELQAQTQNVESLNATITQSTKRIAQITSNYNQQLHNERIDAKSQHNKLDQEIAKQTYRHGLLELKAPQAGMVKDLATHTPGTVVSPGTVLATIVPHNEPLLAEVWVTNLDAGFVVPRQEAKIKLVAYPFQQYGMLDGVVRHVNADASDQSGGSNSSLAQANEPDKPQAGQAQLSYRALVALKSTELESRGQRFKLTPGMQVSAEINLGSRTVLEYLLSPIQKTAHEAWRER
jgi:HlyD family secretion protein